MHVAGALSNQPTNKQIDEQEMANTGSPADNLVNETDGRGRTENTNK